ncbi:transmembrane protein 17A isoform X2 [Silurus meridionalis]|uniref:transmembrane protein 17A isoform X2 n=1 Tax=Silurus meridionalis TaxID=175797 RepID=UPI001EEC25A7|nr:transmembrane protein 17A isoform X2 [Silurus meridionalis]
MPVFYTPIPQNLRVGLAHASGAIFINNKTRDSGYPGGHGVENEVYSKASTHLPLQMLLHFNMFFFPFWSLSEIVMLHLKFTLLPGYYQCLMVPELAAFWLISIAFQLPILLFFLTDEGLIILPLERAVHSLYLAFILGEVFSSFLALRVMARELTMQFHLRQFGHVDTSTMFSFSCGNRSVLPVPIVRDVH